jgi:hypothetical protein
MVADLVRDRSSLARNQHRRRPERVHEPELRESIRDCIHWSSECVRVAGNWDLAGRAVSASLPGKFGRRLGKPVSLEKTPWNFLRGRRLCPLGDIVSVKEGQDCPAH